MNRVSDESIALHNIRHLVRGMGKAQGQGASIQSLRHWWTLSLGQRGEDLERGLESHILLTSLGSDKGSISQSAASARLPSP